jgi:hypothetical protein
MKRTIILLVTILAVGFDSYSQTTRKFALELAPTIGLNRSIIVGSDGVFAEGTKSGLSIGVKAFSSTSSQIYYQTGIFISNKGFREELDDGDYVKISLNYLEVPLNLGYRFAINQQLKGSFFGGAYTGIAIGGKYEEKFIGEFDSFKIFNGGESDIKRLDGGINIGASIEVNQSIILSLQQSYGILSLSKDGEPKLKNRVFNISISYIVR